MKNTFFKKEYIICLSLILMSGCTTVRPQTKAYSEEGIASWYGAKFANKPTASGEIYYPHLMTAAHKALPFNTYVKVINLDNGESVIVKINDRGPFIENRNIDLSYAAAKQIHMIGPGTARVRIVVLPDK